jgi:hypothetical protein
MYLFAVQVYYPCAIKADDRDRAELLSWLASEQMVQALDFVSDCMADGVQARSRTAVSAVMKNSLDIGDEFEGFLQVPLSGNELLP